MNYKSINNKNYFQWNEELIQECIDNNQFEKLNIKDNIGHTGFIRACVSNTKLAIKLALKMLERKDIDFNAQNKKGNTGFILACVYQPEVALKMLEKNNIDLNAQNRNGDTGFMWACDHQSKLIIPLLESEKIDTTLKNIYGDTGWDIAEKHNPEGFRIYKNYLEKQKLSNNIKTKPFKSKPLL